MGISLAREGGAGREISVSAHVANPTLGAGPAREGTDPNVCLRAICRVWDGHLLCQKGEVDSQGRTEAVGRSRD